MIALLDRLVKRGAPTQANKLLAIVRKVYNWAISRDLLEHNPCSQIKNPGKVRQRDRVLNDDEIRTMWQAWESLNPLFGIQFKLHLLTAQRGGEIRTMHWDGIDLENGWWTIPADITKNGLAHRVPLSPPAQRMLEALHACHMLPNTPSNLLPTKGTSHGQSDVYRTGGGSTQAPTIETSRLL